jgi:hypothetical protein
MPVGYLRSSTDEYTIPMGATPLLPDGKNRPSARAGREENAKSDAGSDGKNRPSASAGREEDTESDAGSAKGPPPESADFSVSSSESSEDGPEPAVEGESSEDASEPAAEAGPTPGARGFNLQMQDPSAREILELQAAFVEASEGDYMSWTVQPRSCMFRYFLHLFDTLELPTIWKMIRA